MKERVDVRKLNILHHLKNLESESLGGEIYDLQVKYNFPGLVNECREMLDIYNLPNIIDGRGNQTYSKTIWKIWLRQQ